MTRRDECELCGGSGGGPEPHLRCSRCDGSGVVEWSSTFVAYATAHGRSPAEMCAADEKDWPGGRMCGFILWMGERWREWGALRDLNRTGEWRDRTGRVVLLSDEDHADFESWLHAYAARWAETLTAPVSSKGGGA